MTTLNLGPMIILQTGHSVTSAPYHRSSEALENGVLPFIGDESELRERMKRFHARLVVVCSGETYGSDISVGSGLARGKPPSWLQPIDTKGTEIRVYRMLDDISRLSR